MARRSWDFGLADSGCKRFPSQSGYSKTKSLETTKDAEEHKGLQATAERSRVTAVIAPSSP
jgi:hypothetical protein